MSTLNLRLVVLITLAWLLAGCAGMSKEKQCTVCIDFEQPIAPGTTFGGSAQTPGTVVLQRAAGTMSVENFLHPSGTSSFNRAVVSSPGLGGPGNQRLDVNNISLQFALAAPSREVTFDFTDLGGHENFAVNGGAIDTGNLEALPATVNGVAVTVFTAPIFNSGGVQVGKVGKVRLTGQIREVLVGGQEFSLDNFCVAP